MAIEYQLKKQLDNIIENAFFDDHKKDLYKKFRLKVNDKAVKSYSGTYNERTNTIEIVDIRGKASNNISTLLHEVSHRVEKAMHGKTGHQKTFYEIFKKLLYSALDLGYIDYEEMLDMDHRNVDYNKVMKMLNNYAYSKPNIDIDVNKLIEVSNSYQQKEDLKKLGYHWNAVGKSWVIECSNDKLNDKLTELQDLNIEEDNINITDTGKMIFEYKGKKIVFSKHPVFIKGAYEFRNFLKKDGYLWDSSQNLWYKNFDTKEEKEAELARIRQYYMLVPTKR